MASTATCETCGENASIHVTEQSSAGPVDHHFCKTHAPGELAGVSEENERYLRLGKELVQKLERGISITRQWSGPRRRYTSLAVERRACAAAAVYEQAVVKCERFDSRGLSPTVYPASLILMRRHIS
jgi:hypothetical protein